MRMIADAIRRNIARLHPWMFSYASRLARNVVTGRARRPVHVFLSVCDHFEPLWNDVGERTALEKVRLWFERYPRIAGKYRDGDGCVPRHTFFYPLEACRPPHLEILSRLCHAGFGETEIHLHHDRDTPGRMRRALERFKRQCYRRHRLLSVDRRSGAIGYAFIHGNWALNNSRPDGRYCGVAGELRVLKDTGCYADFTFPSAPDATQTLKINGIYYADDTSGGKKAHDGGRDARAGRGAGRGLLLVQGPLSLNWKERKRGIVPRIENGGIDGGNPVTAERARLWTEAKVGVRGRDDCIFVKLHTHGCQERNMEYLLAGGGLDDLFSLFLERYNDGRNYITHFVSARETFNIIRALEDGCAQDSTARFRDYVYVPAWMR